MDVLDFPSMPSLLQIAELLYPDDSDEENEQLRLDLIRLHLFSGQSGKMLTNMTPMRNGSKKMRDEL